jgi:predicted RNA-binding protein
MQRVSGEVTAVSGATVTIKTEDGTVQVVTTTNTRVMKGRGGVTVPVAELKVGDGLMAMGNLDAPNKTLHAAMVIATDAATVKALRDNLGKTYIVGKVTAIDLDNAKMTVERSDKVSQTILFDDSTSFKRGGRGMGGMQFGGMGAGAATPPAGAPGGESITLADIKVGDNVAGPGSLKGGTFVPTQLTVMTPGQRRRPQTGDATTPAPK